VTDRGRASARIARGALRIALFGVRNEYELKRYLQMTGGIQVLSGPFQGLAYLETSYGSVWPPKVLGTYECELHDVLRKLNLRNYRRIVDIGCAEGYYLSGLAYLARQQAVDLEIDGYDLNAEATQAANWLCRLNGLNARAHCSRYELEDAADDRTLFVVDIEGDEFDLVSEKVLRRLHSCSFLVEVHEPQGSREQLDLLWEVFSATHDVQVVHRQKRALSDFPSARSIPANWSLRLQLMDERRERGNAWIFARSRLV
jgi:SAM-dependent methyltransferase